MEANVASHAQLVREARADLVVFPELSLTGYVLDPSLQVARDDHRLEPLVAACAEAGAIALAGAPVDGRLATLVLGGDGVGDVYAKHHVHASEAGAFGPGDRHVVFDVDGTAVGLGICFDSAHDAHAAAVRTAGAELYAVGVMVLPGDEDHIDERMPARARAHGMWVACANHAGAACGRSGIWAPDGTAVARLGHEAPALAFADLP